MQVVHGIERLSAGHGPVFVVVGVFDGLHIGHHYLLRHLVTVAEARAARPTVITFDHHPDEILTGHAPPLLLDPKERLTRLEDAGVAATVVQHFDLALRETTYDAFVERIRDRVELRGFLMTPDAAFGYERRGTPEALIRLGQERGFEVVVVPPFTLDGRPVRSSEIRAEIAAGHLGAAAALLGRPVTLTGIVQGPGSHGGSLRFELPLALPPDGAYAALVGGVPAKLWIDGGAAWLRADVPPGASVTAELTGRDATAAP
jgi:riboflavin kinase / FMN adenylyltransferase